MTPKTSRLPNAAAANWEDAAQDALTRMARAARRHTGCYLTPEMISALEMTAVGEIWAAPDPRKPRTGNEHEGFETP